MLGLHKTSVMHSSKFGFHSRFATIFLALMPVTLWLALRGYHGLTEDGQIYAFQAFAKLHPHLSADLFLQNTSQDQFTLFSPLYARCIVLLGLENSARLLTLLFTLWLLAAVWNFVRAVAHRGDAAWLAVAFLVIVAGDFGAAGVFRIVEPYLTARLPAEALIITALGCHMRGNKRLGLLLAFGALFIHPLMALPGLLLVICLRLPLRVSVATAIGSIFAVFATAVVAVKLPMGSHILTVMDAAWLDVVRERSQFLFLQFWSIHDWDINVRPFVYMAFTAISVTDERVRKLCAAAALVGAAGLAVAFIGGTDAPLAILVQGQAWRWVWVTVFISVALVPYTALHVFRDKRCGLLCGLLLASGWVLPGVDGTACVTLALIFWLSRGHISSRAAIFFRWLSVALCMAILVWISMKYQAIVSPSATTSAITKLESVHTQILFALKFPAVLLGALAWWWIRTSETSWVPIFLCATLAALSIVIWPAAFQQPYVLAAATDIQEFAQWQNVIPPTSTVLVAPPHDVGAFVWFTLARPNYLTLDQSAGVVFSRATALEVRRRSEVLLPLMDPDWKLLTNMRTKSAGGRNNEVNTRPLTFRSLIRVCTDPQLGFVISPEKVGFDPLRHAHAGAWKNWNLYDCRKVRSMRSAT
jgi:hypothetical protein